MILLPSHMLRVISLSIYGFADLNFSSFKTLARPLSKSPTVGFYLDKVPVFRALSPICEILYANTVTCSNYIIFNGIIQLNNQVDN